MRFPNTSALKKYGSEDQLQELCGVHEDVLKTHVSNIFVECHCLRTFPVRFAYVSIIHLRSSFSSSSLKQSRRLGQQPCATAPSIPGFRHAGALRRHEDRQNGQIRCLYADSAHYFSLIPLLPAPPAHLIEVHEATSMA